MSKLAAAQRQRRYSARKQEERGVVWRNTSPIQWETVRRLQADIHALPKTTLVIPFAQARELVELIRRLTVRQSHLAHRVSLLTVQLCVMRHRWKLTTRVIQGHEDIDAFVKWWLSSRGYDGRDLHAVALGKTSAISRKHQNPNVFRELGLKGAKARWSRARAAKAAQPPSEP